MIKILFIGEIMGKIGRRAVREILPQLKNELKPDLIIANADNLAHGKGVSESTVKEIMQDGVIWFTNGDHAFDNLNSLNLYDSDLPLLRPANYSSQAPGKGFAEIKLKNGHNILLISLIGRVFMSMDYDCPFMEVDKILSNLANKNLSAIIIDMHAEATSEKVALKHYLDGRVSAILGTHTHIMTADSEITDEGTGYITDVGMTGFTDGVIGIGKEGIIKTFLTQIKYPHEIHDTGKAIFNAVYFEINPKNKKTITFKPITKFINIK